MAETFRLRVMSLMRVLYDDEVKSVFLQGDEGEYELLPFHYPLMGALLNSDIKISGADPITIKCGVVMFDNNSCIIICEEHETEKMLYGAGGKTK